MEAQYCLSCGTHLEIRNMGGEDRKACPSCSFVFWGNYSIGVGALIMKDHKILLVRRSQEPGKGLWTNPGGYIEQHEPIEKSIVREVFEETGVTAKVRGIVAAGDMPRNVHNVYLVFLMDYVEGEPKPDNVEVDGAGFYSIEEMESMNVAGLTRRLADIAFSSPSQGLIPDPNPVESLPGYGLYRIERI
ncbi:NUDIX domain-containing protein [Halalkalibacter nanhaiisediminis]|uniref:ADP-ribose pyrophosphatase YjhB (NUDIX family) n=1 Tax=Halalkalibacter nanhaiisediminis TaxID=688079 RepID=A0A562QT67_9BACI|nr:NUDIX domain-containing protein [Halalkalibacter nanhaiisediminis]TWI59843.1 ADP-ribose pyrophosphatase YjhB (NUDIX family) [Halalkalibacter nanhaiisediminis]